MLTFETLLGQPHQNKINSQSRHSVIFQNKVEKNMRNLNNIRLKLMGFWNASPADVSLRSTTKNSGMTVAG